MTQGPKPVKPDPLPEGTEDGVTCFVPRFPSAWYAPGGDHVNAWKWIWVSGEWRLMEIYVVKNKELHIETVPRAVAS